jgi:hypothetical protein
MFKDFIKQQTGVEIYPLISLTLFTVFFAVLIVITIRYRKSFIAMASMMPLDDSQAGTQAQPINQNGNE